MPSCAAVNCSNRSERKKKMCIFPRDPERRKLWASKVKREGWVPNNNAYLCEDHFTSDQWENNRADNKRKLKPNAVPTIFTHIPVKKIESLPKVCIQPQTTCAVNHEPSSIDKTNIIEEESKVTEDTQGTRDGRETNIQNYEELCKKQQEEIVRLRKRINIYKTTIFRLRKQLRLQYIY